MRPAFHRRPPTKARVRAWWLVFTLSWRRLGDVHAALERARGDEERWRLWGFDDHGRRVTHPWRGRRSHPDFRRQSIVPSHTNDAATMTNSGSQTRS